MKWTVCNTPLHGRQRKFCSQQCKDQSGQSSFQSYHAQQKRGRLRKLGLVKLFEGRLGECGYNRNYSILEFHHVESAKKSFQLDLRSLSNRN
jgi:hypothetical protein